MWFRRVLLLMRDPRVLVALPSAVAFVGLSLYWAKSQQLSETDRYIVVSGIALFLISSFRFLRYRIASILEQALSDPARILAILTAVELSC